MYDADLIDGIYEAAVVPEKWLDVMHRLTAVGKGAFASMLVLRDGQMSFVGTPEAEKLIGEYQTLGDPHYNSRIPRSTQYDGFGFHTDLDIFSREEIEKDAFYRDFLRPRGFGWITGAWVRPPSGELINVSVEGFHSSGPFQPAEVDALNRLFPHLARASLWSSRINLQRVQAMAQALDSVGLPAAVLAVTGKLHSANALFEALMPDVVRDSRSRVTLVDAAADALVSDAVARLSVAHAAHQSRSVPLAATPTRPPMIFHVLPVRGAANDVFARSLGLIVVTPVDRATVPTAEVLQGLFDLTPAEAKVARAVAEGKAIDAIAATSGLSRETIRSQLAAVFGKTGMSRQAELVALLSGKGLSGL